MAGQAPFDKSIAFYVGKNLTDDGSVLLGGFGHEPSSHWLEITPARTFPEGTTLEVGITAAARLPGERIEIPQVEQTAKFITQNYSEFAGFPPPLTNGGLNSHHVAARTVWSPSRPELVEMTPNPQRGLSYSDLARIVMERATSAREAAQIVGEMIDAHGDATYGGNSFLFADAEEGWAVVNYAGGAGLWAAERLGPDSVRVLYPGYIGEIPVEFESDPNYMGSQNLVDFAVKQGWFDPAGGDTIDLQQVYGTPFPGPPGADDKAPYRFPPRLEVELREMAPVSLTDMMSYVRDPRWSDDRSGYGQVAHLRQNLPTDLGVLWVAVSPSIASPMIPIHLGAQDVPPEYKQHRYMTKQADSTFLNPEFAPLEATHNAYRAGRRLFYYTCADPQTLLRPVTAELEAFEARQISEQKALEEEVRAMLEDGDDAAAQARLTKAAAEGLLDGLALVDELVAAAEAKAREAGISMPRRSPPAGASWRPESEPMDLLDGSVSPRDRHNCYVPGFETYPRSHGSYVDNVGELIGASESSDALAEFDEVGDAADQSDSSESDVRTMVIAFALGVLGGGLLVWWLRRK